ncbi:WD40 repeat domain-containing protein [Oxalobacter sp. OttesenSCG-928-P03]|nr:WD40 repeat domain-containing protein [Oxalobacter sp. OttesenSCG-928-P03]
MQTESEQQKEWKEKTLAYAKAINDYVARGIKDGWDNVGDEPSSSGREHLVPDLLIVLREANRLGRTDEFREYWPPAHEPFAFMLDENGQSIPMLSLLPDGSILARIGAPYETGRVVRIQGTVIEDVPGVEFFGCCPNKRYFAVAGKKGIAVTDGWQGKEVAFCPWPIGTEDIPEGYKVDPLKSRADPTRLVPFPDGKRVLSVSEDGIFVLSPDGARRLQPTKEELAEYFAWSEKEYPEEELSVNVSMEHGAVSRDGKYIAVGAQDGRHHVFDASLNLIAQIGPHNEYPHYALFSDDSSMLALNACHFYNGATIGVPTAMLEGLNTDYYEEKEGIILLQDGARVYAGVSRNDEFIIGDAYGYIRAVSRTGEYRWQHFIGSTINAMDMSADGKKLVVSTYAGFISLIELDAGRQQPYQIGNGNHYEERRWIFWKNEPAPLTW